MGRKILCIEGSDGSGKQTQANLLAEYLRDTLHYKAKTFSFPNYTNDLSSSLVKAYLSGQFGMHPEDTGPYATSMFYAVDRFVTAYGPEKSTFQESLDFLVLDRYVGSNAIHQGAKLKADELNLFLDWLYDFEFSKLGLPKPSITVYLDVPPQISWELKRTRANKITGGQQQDIHESDRQFLERSYKTGLLVAKRWGWRVIPCVENEHLLPVDAIQRRILKSVWEVL